MDKDANLGYFNEKNSYILGLILLYKLKNENKELVCNIPSKFLNKDVTKELKNLGIILTNDLFCHFVIQNKNYIELINNIKISTIINEKKGDVNGLVRSIFEKYGTIYTDNYTCNVILENDNEDLIKSLKEYFNYHCDMIKEESNYTLIYKNVNCIDFLYKIYNNCENYCDINYYNKYLDIVNNVTREPIINIFKDDKNAIIPTKTRGSDAGYDLTVIKKVKQFNNKTSLYDTGIKLEIPNGYYVEVFPRSSLSKTGYMLANSVGIIDQGYTGNIFIALTKIDDASPDIELPFRCCQMILKKQYYPILNYKNKNDEILLTDRNVRGYGEST